MDGPFPLSVRKRLKELCTRTPGEEIAITAQPKIKSPSQIFRYDQSIFCLPHRPKISDFFDLCLHWVSVVRAENHILREQHCCNIGSPPLQRAAMAMPTLN